MSGDMLRLILAALTLALSPLVTGPASAGPFDEVVRVEVLPGWREGTDGHVAGLRVSLAPGWKTYWRAPGDAGIPPQFDWSGSDNVSAVGVGWPTPEVFELGGMRSIGYSGTVVFPLRVVPNGNGEMRLRGTVQLGICEEVCIPVEASIDATLPDGGSRDPAIVAALVDRPLSADEVGVGRVTCTFLPNELGVIVRTIIELPDPAGIEAAVVEAGDPEVWVSEPAMRREGRRLLTEAIMMHLDGGAFSVERSDMRITLIGQGQAIDIRGCTAPG